MRFPRQILVIFFLPVFSGSLKVNLSARVEVFGGIFANILHLLHGDQRVKNAISSPLLRSPISKNARAVQSLSLLTTSTGLIFITISTYQHDAAPIDP